MAQTLIDRIAAERGWTRIADTAALDAFAAAPGVRCLFVPGDPAKNLESGDVAVILPEIVKAFGGAFGVALVEDGVEREARERFDVWPTPSLIFVSGGAALGSIPRVRDWDDYMARTREILAQAAVLAN